MNAMMALPLMILLVLMNSTPDGSVMKKRTCLEKLKASQIPLTVKQSARIMMIASFSTIMWKDPRGGASFTAAAATLLNMSGAENIMESTNALLALHTQIWMTAATLNCFRDN